MTPFPRGNSEDEEDGEEDDDDGGFNDENISAPATTLCTTLLAFLMSSRDVCLAERRAWRTDRDGRDALNQSLRRAAGVCGAHGVAVHRAGDGLSTEVSPTFLFDKQHALCVCVCALRRSKQITHILKM